MCEQSEKFIRGVEIIIKELNRSSGADKYNKLKRTYEALSELTKEVKEEITHLESISAALDIALQEEDLVEIKEELTESGYIRRKGGNKKVKMLAFLELTFQSGKKTHTHTHTHTHIQK